MDIESIIQGGSYVGIFVLMVSNGFISFPSSQILYIIVGYMVGTGYLTLLPASLAGALGNTLGNVVLYEAIRLHGIKYVERWKIFRKEDIRKVEILFKKRGVWFLFVGKLLPAIKVFVPIPAALGRVDRRIFSTLMFIASWVWSFMFIAIGYYFGKSSDVWRSYGTILLFVALFIVIMFYRLLNSKEVLAELSRDDGTSDAQEK